MITHIDVSTVLRRTVCELYSNLVTRPTGVAVRTEIEHQIATAHGRSLTIIDFGNVGLLDYSCADEVVAKLLLRAPIVPYAGDAYFVFRGIDGSHLEAIESVLERHGLAIVMQLGDGAVRLLGDVSAAEHDVWSAACTFGGAAADVIAGASGVAVPDALLVLDQLCARRLVMRDAHTYMAVGARASMTRRTHE